MEEAEVGALFPVTPWPHQTYGVCQTWRHLGQHHIVTLQSPTGGGKSFLYSALTKLALQCGMNAVIYTNRRLITRQTMLNLGKNSIEFGVRAASLSEYEDLEQRVQISSIQTEAVRVLKQRKWELHHNSLVMVDEAHLQASGDAEKIIRMHLEAGDRVVLITATPVGLSHLSPVLIQAGKNSELRACKAHVRAVVKCPWEFDLHNVRRKKTGEYMDGEKLKAIYSQQVVGEIFRSWRQHNPDARQTLLFAPSVPSSIWTTEEFERQGVKAASIDSTTVLVDGKQYRENAAGNARADVIARWEAGEIKVLSNRFVMREGVDSKTIYHMILATPVGQLQTYIQMCGRAIRYSDQTPDHVIITDHGGSVWEFDSPNRDIDWNEYYWLSEAEIHAKVQADARQRKPKDHANPDEQTREITCPHCGTIRRSGSICPTPPIGCGQMAGRKARKILEASGKLVDYDSITPKERKKSQDTIEQKAWDRLYWACRNSKNERGMTFAQMAAAFERQHGHKPEGLKRMPCTQTDWARKVKAVPLRELTGWEPRNG